MLAWIRERMLGLSYISDADLDLLHLTDSPAEAVEIVVRSQDSLSRMDRSVSTDY
jgi:predicted Rossmann-fold nucleotide-binding protein